MMLRHLQTSLLAPLSIGLSLAFFVGLSLVIQAPSAGLQDPGQRFGLNWVQPSSSPDVETLRPPPPPPPPPSTPEVAAQSAPAAAAASSSSAVATRVDGLNMALPAINADFNATALPSFAGMGGMGTAETPVYREQPQYPRRALERRLEGWVELAFEVDEQGQVIPSTIEVVDAEPKQVFDREARRAIARWRFAAYEMNGGGSRQLRQRLEFRMEQGG